MAIVESAIGGRGINLPQGYRLEEYEIEKAIGSGGFGITYLGLDTNLHTRVAVKEYFPATLASRIGGETVEPKTQVATDVEEFQWGLDRFIDEARTLAKFSHTNIVRVRRYIETNGTAYIVMDFCEGQPLSEVIKTSTKGLEESHIRLFLLPLLEGLNNVHEQGMLHRDIKPHNIIVRENGSPVLIDFGAARQAIGVRSQSISTILTPGYAPIEQYSSRGNQGPWTDIYAMGAVVYAAMTGRPPDEATERIRKDMMPPLCTAAKGQGTDSFLRAIDWALSPEEENRPQSISEWMAALDGEAEIPQEISNGQTIRVGSGQVVGLSPSHVPPTVEAQKGSSKFATIAAGVGIAGILIAAALVFSLFDFGSPPVESVEIPPSELEQEPAPQAEVAEVQPAIVEEQPIDPEVLQQDRFDFELAQRIRTADAYRLYIRLHPDGAHIESARQEIETLD